MGIFRKRKEAHNNDNQGRIVLDIKKHDLSLTVESNSVGLKKTVEFNKALGIELQVKIDFYIEPLINQLSKIRFSQIGLYSIVDKAIN